MTDKATKEYSRAQLRRREDIVRAALKVFDQHGFEAARMIDIANEAEVAKGTLYLYFKNKVALLEGVVQTVVMPSVDSIEQAAQEHSGSAQELLVTQLDVMTKRFMTDEYRILLRLLISEGPKFPQLTQFYYENVITPGMQILRQTLAMGVDRGEFRPDINEIEPFIFAGSPVFMAIWRILFHDSKQLDREKLFADQMDVAIRGILSS